MVLTILAGAIGWVAASAQTPGRGAVPSVPVRPPDSRTLRGAAAGLLGWRVGIPAGAFRQLTFSEAAGKADALGLAFIEGSISQKVSPEISRNLDYNLSPDEITKVKNRLAELRLRMLAYRTDSIGSDESSRRKLFEFAKGLGVETIICAPDLASLHALDKLATEFGVAVAVENSSLKSLMSALEGRGPLIGVNADIGKWMQEGIKPAEGLSLAKDRTIAVTLRDRSGLGSKGRDVVLGSGAAGVTEFLLAMSRLHPPAAPEWPPKCTNCGAPRVASKPMFLAVDSSGAADTSADLAQSLAAFERCVRPAMGFRVNEIARKTPITSIDGVPAVERQKIEAALPRARDMFLLPATSARTTCEPERRSGPSTRFRIPASMVTIRGLRMRGNISAATTRGVSFRLTRNAASPTSRSVPPPTTYTAPIAKGPVSSAIACWLSTPAPGNAYGTSRLCIMTFGITTWWWRRS